MPYTLLRFALLFALLLIGYATAHAQTAPSISRRTITGFGDPEPLAPRYPAAQSATEPEARAQSFAKAYSKLFIQSSEQGTDSHESKLIQSVVPPAPVKPEDTPLPHTLPGSF